MVWCRPITQLTVVIIVYILYRQCHFRKADIMPISTNLLHAKTCFALNPDFFAEIYAKLHTIFVTVLSLTTLQGSVLCVCVHVSNHGLYSSSSCLCKPLAKVMVKGQF